ncbi:hypothetical protein Scep_023261 [Stephania cephalantha]|uniref:Replication protein A 32 kDa subunit n=1 Tax=Stephania cephalantha TaxID=152367 RepID=A0AAP0EUD0_9MAGN
MYGSQFDGNAAFSGGGFMPSQATQTTDLAFSPAKNRDSQGLLPLTVKQINDAFNSSDDKSSFTVDGVDVNNVTLVGVVSNKAERVTEVSFCLDDGTGRIDCHRWMNESIDSKEMEEIRYVTISFIRDGIYVRIHGHLKGFQGKRHLVVFSVRPVKDFNEIAYHFIESIYVHVHNTKFSAQFGFGGVKGIDKKSLIICNSLQNFYCHHLYNSASNVIDIRLNLCNLEKGIHRMNWESIRSLEEEGAIYSTIDDCHYKSTVNG